MQLIIIQFQSIHIYQQKEFLYAWDSGILTEGNPFKLGTWALLTCSAKAPVPLTHGLKSLFVRYCENTKQQMKVLHFREFLANY